MSLKAFHVVFIVLSLILSIGMAVYSFSQISNGASPMYWVYGIVASVGTVALLVYGKYFLKKLRHISYL